HQARRGGRRRAEEPPAAAAAAHRLEVLPRPLHLGEHALGVVEQGHAIGRRAQATGVTLEQRRADVLLQFLEPLRQA
ncbi:hypothetical protein SC81_23015, partial [Vibrio vulnificus]